MIFSRPATSKIFHLSEQGLPHDVEKRAIKNTKKKNVKNHHPPSFVFFILLVFCRSYMACTILNCMFSPSQLEQHSRRIVCRVKDKPIYCPSHNHDLLRTWGHRWLHHLNVLYIRMIHNISILYYYIGRVAIGHLIFL